MKLPLRCLGVMLCTIVLVPGDTLAYQASSQTTQRASPQNQAPKIPSDQMDSLVAPVALYPDPLLAQTLAASTYPLEIVQLQQWLAKNPGLKDQALADAVSKQPWDPSVQAMAALPEVVKRLANDIQWTADLGNAFLSQQSDLMDAIQRMRKKAHDKGALKSSQQQTVETQVIENKPVIVIEQANPEVLYVPSYDPLAVWGYPAYPYPAVYYPGYYAGAALISFGIGVAMGAFWSGGWGWGCGWGGGNLYVNRNNNFNRNTNIGGGNRGNLGGGNRGNLGGGNRGNLGGGNRGNLGNRPANPIAGGDRGGLGGNRGGGLAGNRPSTLPSGATDRWQHNPEHRGGTPYRDRATADRFGGVTRGDNLSNRQASARQQLGRQGGNLASTRSGSGLGLGDRGGGADRIAGRDISRGGNGNRDAFGGGSRGSRGYNGSSARSSGNRGASSMGSRGGFGGGGRGFGGGGRGGGGRRR